MTTVQLFKGDCLVEMQNLPDKSIDLICADLPYQTTQNQWDKMIPLDLLWGQYERLITDSGSIILFGQGIFSARLIMSNLKMYKYTIIWEKTSPKGHLNAKKRPLRSHEDILVFFKKQSTYNPQKTTGHKPTNTFTKHTSDGTNYGKTKIGISGGGSTERYPKSVWKFASDTQKSSLHPTQKPVALLEYLIKTYTNEGDTVLDNTMGSGTCGVAASNLNRNFIGIEMDDKYFEIAEKRINEASFLK